VTALARLFRPRREAGSPYPLDREWAGLLDRLRVPRHAPADILASGSLHPHFQYRYYTKPKRDGGRREITEPDARLKRVQQEILARYLAGEASHPAAVAYQRGRSVADHAWAHAGAEVLVTADVRDFFPTTHEHRIAELWDALVGGDPARLLARLTTDRGGLPQGAPTSPALSNLVNRELDTRLTMRASAAGARYSRYCDDLAFSWPEGAGPPADFEAGVRAVLHEFGYALHPEKGWRVFDRRDEPELTGLVLTRQGRVRLPGALRTVMRRLARSGDPRDAVRLQGYLGYEAMVTRPPGRPGWWAWLWGTAGSGPRTTSRRSRRRTAPRAAAWVTAGSGHHAAEGFQDWDESGEGDGEIPF
jgi:RNA-directed DNA polymerase